MGESLSLDQDVVVRHGSTVAEDLFADPDDGAVVRCVAIEEREQRGRVDDRQASLVR